MAASSTTTQRVLMLVCGATLVYNAIHGVRSGRVGFGYSIVKRSDNPTQFWFAVITSWLGVLAAIVAILLL